MIPSAGFPQQKLIKATYFLIILMTLSNVVTKEILNNMEYSINKYRKNFHKIAIKALLHEGYMKKKQFDYKYPL